MTTHRSYRTSPQATPPPWTPPTGNFREGTFTAALVRPQTRSVGHGGQGGTSGVPSASSQRTGHNRYNQNALGGSGTGAVDWDDLASVQRFRGLASQRLTDAQSRLSSITPETDFQIRFDSDQHPSKNFVLVNPYFSQGLGPETYEGKYLSDRAQDEVRWFEATERKFALREQELKGIANAPASAEFGAGTQGAYAAQQTAREGLGRPFAEGARAAELLRQDRGPRTGGGAAQGGAGRQASRARTAESRRLASRDRTTGSGGGGGGGPRRLRAANLLRQPLGAGNQLSAQVLG